MSASLVGSEMCIRDRYVISPAENPNSLQAFGARAVRAQERPQHWTGTVSYTHLTLPTICSV
eukprot:12477398-Alexandrium_andersonii.AAC.1